MLKDIKIKSIKRIPKEKVYDITVPDNHNFFTTNGVLSHNCMVILDESQNTTQEQMKMFLSRIGDNCKMVINGDTMQTDVQNRFENALTWAWRKLKGVDSKIRVVEFGKCDIVRHPLIEKILKNLETKDDIDKQAY